MLAVYCLILLFALDMSFGHTAQMLGSMAVGAMVGGHIMDRRGKDVERVAVSEIRDVGERLEMVHLHVDEALRAAGVGATCPVVFKGKTWKQCAIIFP